MRIVGFEPDGGPRLGIIDADASLADQCKDTLGD